MGQSGAVAICASMKSAKGSPRIPQIVNETSTHGAICSRAPSEGKLRLTALEDK